MVQQMAHAAHMLNEQAHSLVSAVSVFKLTGAAHIKDDARKATVNPRRPIQSSLGNTMLEA
jgi:hypothetical protein